MLLLFAPYPGYLAVLQQALQLQLQRVHHTVSTHTARGQQVLLHCLLHLAQRHTTAADQGMLRLSCQHSGRPSLALHHEGAAATHSQGIGSRSCAVWRRAPAGCMLPEHGVYLLLAARALGRCERARLQQEQPAAAATYVHVPDCRRKNRRMHVRRQGGAAAVVGVRSCQLDTCASWTLPAGAGTHST